MTTYSTNDYIILMDMDDTIENLLCAWVKYLNRKHNTKVKITDVKCWDMSKAFPTLKEDDIYASLRDVALWKAVRPKKDAIKYVKKLFDEGFQIYVCTSTHYLVPPEKFTYALFRYFPYLKNSNLIKTSHKQLIMGDILIDDYENNLIGGKYKKVLFDSVHNKQFEADDVTRAHNWKQCYDIIHKHYEEKKRQMEKTE